MSQASPKSDGQTQIRGLGCGGQPTPVGKSNKMCVDCQKKSFVEAEVIVCPRCGGPLAS